MIDTDSQQIRLDLVVKTLWRAKLFIFLSTCLFATLAVFYALSLPNVYRAEVLVAPADDAGPQGLGGLSDQFGGIAALTGLNLPTAGNEKVEVALEVMQSKRFITEFVARHKLKPDLLAASEWQLETREVLYNPAIYNPETHVWAREVELPLTVEPSDWEVFEAFKEILSIEEQQGAPTIRIAIEHVSPDMAANWLSQFISDLNNDLRESEKQELENTIAYLNQRLQQTSVAELRALFYELIQEQTKKLMLSEVRDEYVFKVIDPASVPQFKHSPKRALIAILGVLIGGMTSVFLVLVWGAFRPQETTQSSQGKPSNN